jgi:hypothetical protein
MFSPGFNLQLSLKGSIKTQGEMSRILQRNDGISEKQESFELQINSMLVGH